MPKVKGQKSSKVMLSKKEAKVVRGLIKGDTKQTAIVTSTGFSGSNSAAAFLTSSDTTWQPGAGSPVAASTQGLIESNLDSVTIKHVEIKGFFDVAPLATTAAGLPATDAIVVRELVVWYYKPTRDANNLGDGPVNTDVLVTGSVESMVVNDSANAGRFKVLSDKTFNLGSNVYIVASNTMKETSKQRVDFERKIVINKVQHYKVPPTDTNKGGHFDSDVDAGQITRGFPVLYYLVTGNAGTFTSSISFRTTYVG